MDVGTGADSVAGAGEEILHESDAHNVFAGRKEGNEDCSVPRGCARYGLSAQVRCCISAKRNEQWGRKNRPMDHTIDTYLPLYALWSCLPPFVRQFSLAANSQLVFGACARQIRPQGTPRSSGPIRLHRLWYIVGASLHGRREVLALDIETRVREHSSRGWSGKSGLEH